MSLLLDARKKSRPAQPAQRDDHVFRASQPGPQGHLPGVWHLVRNNGHNLFAAKFPLPQTGRTRPDHNLQLALGGAVLLFAAGAVYIWHAPSARNTTPAHSATAPPIPPFHQMQTATVTEPAIQKTPVAELGKPEQARLAAAAERAPTVMPQPRNNGSLRPDNNPIRIEQHGTEPADPLLGDAYLAFRNGKLAEARQLYLAAIEKDAQNPDVLLGLAAIAQRHGENHEAAQYFGRVLALDPRNAVANAGMSGLSADDDHNESRLKILLREQHNSAALHFALGNLFAGQSRWGEAQQAYFNAYTLESGNAEFAFNLAVSLDHLGQNKLAAQHYQRAMQLDPTHSAGFAHAQISQRAQELAR